MAAAADAADEDAGAVELPSDALVALRLLRQQFPRTPGCETLPRLLLVTQVYALVRDRTAADRALAALARSGAVRRFKLATGRDEYGLMFAEDYASQAEAAKHDAAASGAAAFDAFAQRVLPACPGVAVATSELRRLLRGDACAAAPPAAAPPLSERAVDDALALLMNAGLLTRAMEPGAEAMLFSAPNTGAFQRALVRGRTAVRAALARKQHRQALMVDVEKQKLRGCVLPARFIVRDMLGGGAILAAEVPAGTLLRLVRD